jgi:hypothetical protein
MLLDATPPDTVTAKTVLMKGCTAPDDLVIETRTESCEMLLAAKLVDEQEMTGMCTANVDTCGPIIRNGGLSEDNLIQLCLANENVCKAVAGAVHDAELRAEANFLSQLSTAELKLAIGSVSSSEEDEDSDAACHKDTDCKGNRICVDGDCVDDTASSARPAPPPAPPAAKLGDPQCDAAMTTIHELQSCPALREVQSDLSMAEVLATAEWQRIAAERRSGLAVRCASAGKRLRDNGAELGCPLTR